MSSPARVLRRGSRLTRRGSSLIEVLIAMVVLALAATGAVGGIVFASRDVHDGQLLQVKRLLLEASTQRLWLAAKGPLLARAVPRPTQPPTTLAPGAAPWRADPTVPVTGDPSSGAYFMLSATGHVEPLAGIPAGTACNDAALPEGTYCREVLVTTGLPLEVPPSATALLPAGSRPVTVWTRVVRKGDTADRAQFHNEVFVQ
ncbi:MULTISPECIES: type IV pilus modification PilV family protein [Myxococcus]|uniref:type IV pilus modification PilV family protein n=1 Tax=Myxococcus TaxID=32 RepID=UPI0013D416F7|nr:MULTISPECIES: type II secretion system protein [Myxococcus]NVJ25725.1 prepilin-type N-terminal cleavage/methylation domain-containing protein [Myxococcus sp. AM011]